VGIYIAVLGLVLLLVATVGAYAGTVQTGRICFSPSGSSIAWLATESVTIPWGPENLDLSEVLSLRWCSVHDPHQQHYVKIASRHFKLSGTGLSAETHMYFSPDSRHLAVIWPKNIMILDLATGDHRKLPTYDEILSSFAWLNDTTIGYVSYTKQQDVITRTFWRQGIAEDQAERTAMYQESELQELPLWFYQYDWPREYWSPRGTWVIFGRHGKEGQPSLLHIPEGTIRSIGRADSHFKKASWRSDETRLMWIAYNSTAEAYEVFLLDLVSDQTTDLTEEFTQSLGKPLPDIEIDREWTPDGKYVVANDSGCGGHLIQPRPWRAIAIGKMMAPGSEKYLPVVRRQPAVNMLLVNLFKDGEYIVDYKGQKRKRLGEGDLSGWSISPDGRCAVKIGLDGKLFVKTLSEPASLPKMTCDP